MCPVCLTVGSLYVAGGLSAGAVTTFVAARLLNKRPESNPSTASTETEGDEVAAVDDRNRPVVG